MKVLLWIRPNDNLKGGDINQAYNTKKSLERLGIEVDITDSYGLEKWRLEEYDIIHLFVLNVINNHDKFKILRGKNVIFSPIYRDPNYDE